MRILFVISDSTARGGTEIVAFNIIHKLQELGMECALLSRYQYTGEDPCVLNMGEEERERYWSILQNPINKLTGGKLSDVFFKKIVYRFATELDVDWIINHTYDLCAAIPMNGRWQTAQVLHWSIIGYEKSVLSNIRKEELPYRILSRISLSQNLRRWRKALTSFSRIICLTKTANSEIINAGIFENEVRLSTIPNPILHSSPSDKISNLLNNNIIFVGRLSQEKGVLRLLRIWERISRTLNDVTLSIYGEGSAQNEMEKHIQDHHIERVHFLGFSHKLEDIYTTADLCLMTSDTEGFGMVLIEAMYYGVPCISFDCPISPKEVILDAGVIVPCFDEDMYAKEVVDLYLDKERMSSLQSKAVKRASDFYIDKIIRRWADLLYSNQQ